MKTNTFTVQAPTQRRHQMLFDQDLPFRGRVEKSKTLHNRKVKHKKQYQE